MYQASEVTEQAATRTQASAALTHSDNTDFVFTINSVTLKKPWTMLDVLLNGTPVSMQLDKASDVSVVSEEETVSTWRESLTFMKTPER